MMLSTLPNYVRLISEFSGKNIVGQSGRVRKEYRGSGVFETSCEIKKEELLKEYDLENLVFTISEKKVADALFKQNKSLSLIAERVCIFWTYIIITD